MNNRAINIIKETIKTLNVNLTGATVLTEVGSNNYLYTPIVASLCGASKVYALAKDNSYGMAKDVVKQGNEICNRLHINNVHFCENNLPDEVFETVDLISNSGNLRPIDEYFLSKFKRKVVIPLMFEAWELRKEDIDIEFCKKNNYKVAGTWENHPSIKVFDYCGMLAVKMILDAGLEVTNNKIIVWSDDHFGQVISEKLINENAEVICTTSKDVLYENIKDTDVVFLAAYAEAEDYFAEHGIFDIEKLKAENSDVTYVHLFGKVDLDFCNKNEINISPKINGRAQVMTHTLGYVGLNPILKLQVAGFKVGQELLEDKLSTLSQLI